MNVAKRRAPGFVILLLLALVSCGCQHHHPEGRNSPVICVDDSYRIILFDATGAKRGYRVAKSFQPQLTRELQLVDADGFGPRMPPLFLGTTRVRINHEGAVQIKSDDGSKLWTDIGHIPLAIVSNGSVSPGRTYSEVEIDQMRAFGSRREGRLFSPVEWEVVADERNRGEYHLRVVGDR